MTYLGAYEVTFDKKHRFCFPAEFKEQIAASSNKPGTLFIHDRGLDKMLFIYTSEYLEQYLARHKAPESQASPLDRTFSLDALMKDLSSCSMMQKQLDSNGRLHYNLEYRGITPPAKFTIAGTGEFLVIFLGNINDYLKLITKA
jgi:DNA-binding transcriptional regulator/RsmH inhibitor MraZ